MSTTTIGIIGAGTIGRALAAHAAKAGHHVLISNSRGPETLADVAAERERLTKELARLGKILASTESQLNNPAFIAKAPGHIVDGLRKQYTQTKTLYDKTKGDLDALGL